MIFYNHGWLGGNIKHNSKTVREFIEKEIMTKDDKENKYFRICLKNGLDGCRKLVLYFQDNKLKSHHSTGKKFNYNDVIDYEVYEYYSIDDIKNSEVRSFDYDSIEEMETELNEESLDTIGMTEDEKVEYAIRCIFG